AGGGTDPARARTRRAARCRGRTTAGGYRSARCGGGHHHGAAAATAAAAEEAAEKAAAPADKATPADNRAATPAAAFEGGVVEQGGDEHRRRCDFLDGPHAQFAGAHAPGRGIAHFACGDRTVDGSARS